MRSTKTEKEELGQHTPPADPLVNNSSSNSSNNHRLTSSSNHCLHMSSSNSSNSSNGQQLKGDNSSRVGRRRQMGVQKAGREGVTADHSKMRVQRARRRSRWIYDSAQSVVGLLREIDMTV